MQKGFSLIELLAVTVLTAVLATLAFQAWGGTLARYRIRQAVDQFTSSLDLARTESLRRGSWVVIERLNNCNQRDWSCGWRVYEDLNNNAQFDTNETVMLITDPTAETNSGVQVTTNANQLINRLQLAPNGTSPGTKGSFFFQSVALSANCTQLLISAGVRWRTQACSPA
jgi:prepilin-type N-terminal cleavage/methylation domain-containing protein